MNAPAAPAEAGPRRIQLRRTKGWRKPAGAIVVARPSKWGNPYAVVPVENSTLLIHTSFRWSLRERGYPVNVYEDRHEALTEAIALYRTYLHYTSGTSGRSLAEEALDELAGHDLACWCPVISHGAYVPCHADVLLELANADQAVTVAGGAS